MVFKRKGHRTRIPFSILVIITLLFSSALALVPPSVSSGQSGSQSCTPANTLRDTVVTPPDSLNALTLNTASSDGYFVNEEYMGLVAIPFPNGTADSQLSVTDWIYHNSNYTQWTFNVRPGLKWSDGSNVSSADILATYGPAFGLNSTYDFLGLRTEVKSESALNSSAAVYVLNQTDAFLPEKMSMLAFIPIYPASFVKTQGAASINMGTDLVDGPFYVANYSAGQAEMTMLRNPYYRPLPNICRINVNFVETASLTTSQLIAGSTDLAIVEPSNSGAILADQNLHLVTNNGLQVSDVQYNDSIYPYNMTSFRQALAFGINQSQIVGEAFDGLGLTAYNAEGAVSPVANFWYNPHIKQYSFNQNSSVSLLRNIGISKGSNGYMQYPNGTDVSLALWTDTSTTTDVIAATVIQQNLESLGFKVNLQTTSFQSIVGDYFANVGGIRSAMIFSTVPVAFWGSGWIDVQPAWNVYWLAPVPNPYWEYPPSQDALYQGNLSAFLSTTNVSLDQQYAYNIQALNAQDLPTLILAYPDNLWAYNAQTWTNWPSSTQLNQPYWPNWNSFALLAPISTTSSATSTIVASSSSTSNLSASTTFTNNSASSILTGQNTLILAAIVVVVLVVIGVFAFLLRSRKNMK